MSFSAKYALKFAPVIIFVTLIVHGAPVPVFVVKMAIFPLLSILCERLPQRHRKNAERIMRVGRLGLNWLIEHMAQWWQL